MDPSSWLAELRRTAEDRERAGLRRRLAVRPPDSPMIDMAGNDYLGLARHPAVVDATIQAISEYGLGATGSRLVRGTTDAHSDLDDALAGWLGTGERWCIRPVTWRTSVRSGRS